MKETINICYTPDLNFLNPTATSVKSLLENNNQYFFNIYIVYSDKKINEKIISKFKITFKGYNCELIFIFDDKSNINQMKGKNTLPTYISEAAFLRLNLYNLLDVDKLLYIDGDTIIKGNILDLYKTNPKYVGAVKGSESFVGSNHYKLYKTKYDKLLTTKVKNNYINTGIMVMNLKNLRADNKFKNYSKTITKNQMPLGDQDYINYILKGEVKLVDYKYNVRTFFNRKGYDINQAVILHFVSFYKPWKSRWIVGHKFFLEYKKYKLHLHWNIKDTFWHLVSFII